MNLSAILSHYNKDDLTVGVLGGHSALDVCHGAKCERLRTLCVAKKGREKTYAHYFRSDDTLGRGCIDNTIVVDAFEDVLNESIQEQLRSLNTIFVHNRYFWVYFSDYSRVEEMFEVPIFGNRSYVKIEERDQEYTQYDLLRDAGIRTPHIFKRPEDIDRPVIVKASEAARGYERAFFVVNDGTEWETEGSRLEAEGKVSAHWRSATIEEFIVGAPVNLNFFYSPLTEQLELMGTDMRRQTNLDGFLRMLSDQQMTALQHIDLKMIETGHVAVTVKESLLEKIFALGEQFVDATKRYDNRGIIGPFALQGAVIAEEGREEIVIFDVSLRIPGSPGTVATPYSRYLWGESISMGERIAQEIRAAVDADALEKVVT